MGKLAFLFPGQGSQEVGMGRALVDAVPESKAVYDAADAALGEALSKTILDGPEDELKRTANTQPAILTMSIAALRSLQAAGAPEPDFVAGHSLGEYSALVAAGSLKLEDAIRAVRARGTFMQDAVPEGVGAMAAVLGLDADKIKAICDETATDAAWVAVANYNGAAQTVIAGHQAGVAAAAVKLKEAGAKRVVDLPVSAPFHCKLMAPVQGRLQEVLEALEVSAPKVPVISNVEATPNTDASRVVPLLVEQVVAPVRFTEIGQRLLDEGVDTFVEIGPGKVLVGMLKRMDRSATFLPCATPDEVTAVIAKLKETRS